MPTQTFPGQFASLAKISEFVAQATEQAGFDSKDVYAVRLAVDEACSNIIEHAYGGDADGNIICTCDVEDAQIKITLKDFGTEFSPEDVPEPKFDVPLDELKPRGAGLFFMRKLMDEVHFDFHKNKGNVLVMVKRK